MANKKRFFNAHTAPIDGIPPGAEGELDADNPAVKTWREAKLLVDPGTEDARRSADPEQRRVGALQAIQKADEARAAQFSGNTPLSMTVVGGGEAPANETGAETGGEAAGTDAARAARGGRTR